MGFFFLLILSIILTLIDKGIAETVRCLKKGGHLVASVRADNLENRLIDLITEKREKKGIQFHKWCFKSNEFENILTKQNLKIVNKEMTTNVPFMHKFKLFRKRSNFDEKQTRSLGFQLNAFGTFIYTVLKFLFPCSFGTTIVFTTLKI